MIEPPVSVVVCTRNRPDLIGQAIDSLLGLRYSNYEIVVVDQSDSKDTKAAIDALPGSGAVRYIHTPIAGLSRAYNIGIAHSSGEMVAFTDDDCIVPEDWLDQVVESFEAHPDVDLLYGQVECPRDLEVGTGVVPELRFTDRRRLGGRWGLAVIGMGANFAARANFLQAIGGFDEVLGGGGKLKSAQDFDLQFRAFRQGRVVLLEPSVKVLHYGLRRPDEWRATLTAYGVGDGGFYMKHIRCGDVRAAWMFGKILASQLMRVLMKPLIGRRHDPNYLKGLIQGARGSFAFGVSRPQRLYIAAPAN